VIRCVVVVAIVVALFAAAGCATTPAPAVVRQHDRETIAFVDVDVVDGTGGAPLHHQDVVVQGDRIVAVAPTGGGSSGSAVPGRVIDGRGKTLLPGFVDAHVHVLSSGGRPFGPGFSPRESLERFTAVGVTTVFDMGSSASDLLTLQQAVDDGSIVGPRIFHTNLMITGRGSHPIALGDTMLPGGSALVGLVMPQVQTEADIPAALDVVEKGAPDFIKVIVDRMPADEPIMDRAVLQALVRAARARGHKVFVHAGDVDDAVAAAEAGCTALAHLPWRGVLTADKAARLKASGVVVVTTAWMWERTTALLQGRFSPTPEEAWLVPPALLHEAQSRPDHPRLRALGHELDDNVDHRAASLRALLEAHVPIVTGTDSVLPGVWPGSAYVAERRALLAAGVDVAALIPAMTSRAAQLMAGPDADFGVVQAGKAADLVLVDGDPLADPAALDRVRLVVQRGRLIEPLLPSSPTPSTSTTP
jgi:imidazolonepropionase-like amidohydrolase